MNLFSLLRHMAPLGKGRIFLRETAQDRRLNLPFQHDVFSGQNAIHPTVISFNMFKSAQKTAHLCML